MKTNFTEPEEIILEESPDIPPHYLKVKAIIGIYIAVIYEMLKTLNIKRDGAIDEITDKLYKRFDSVLDFYINIKAQRVEDIIVSKIIENLDYKKSVSGGDNNASRMYLLNLQKLFSSDVIKAFKEKQDAQKVS